MRYLLLFVLALALPAAAQTVTPTAAANGTAVGAASNSQSTGQATVTTSPTQSITQNTAPYPADTKTRITSSPQVFAPSMQPTTPCTSIVSGGVSVVGFGMSLGGSYEDRECTRREFARVLAQMGFPDAGVAVLCLNAEVAQAAPQLCKRSDYVATRPEDYIGSERPVMPPARISTAPAPVQPPAYPVIGTIGYGPSGAQFRYTGTGWVAEEVWQRQTADRNLPRPEVLTNKESAK